MSNTLSEESPPATARLNRAFLRHPALERDPVSRIGQSDQPDEFPLCDRCGSAMTYLGQIPPGRLSAGKIVFRCYTCNRVISLPATA
jgi:hypothetical protein